MTRATWSLCYRAVGLLGMRMQRRHFIAGISGMAIAGRGFATPAAASHRIAFVHAAIPVNELTEAAGPFWIRRFFERLAKLGLVEGRNLVVERYSAEGRADRFAAVAAAVVQRHPDVIVANYNPLVAAIQSATQTIPVVAIVGDPVRSGFVRSLARPGGNITGASVDAGIEIYGKELQILQEAIPNASRVAFLASRDAVAAGIEQVLRAAGERLGITLIPALQDEVGEPQISRAFTGMAQQRADAVIVSPESSLLAHRGIVVESAQKARLPALYPYRDYVEAGGLIAYAPDLGELAERMAEDVHQILAGAEPADIPMVQPSKIDLIINEKTARSLGLPIPSSLLARADEVIE